MAKQTYEVHGTCKVPGVGRVVADPQAAQPKGKPVRVAGAVVLVDCDERKAEPLVATGSLRQVAEPEPAKPQGPGGGAS